MAEKTIRIQELVKALRRIKTLDELRCMGCGYEHDCSIHGCVIIRQAADVIDAFFTYFEEYRSCSACIHSPKDHCPNADCCQFEECHSCPCGDCVDGDKFVLRIAQTEV